MANIEGLTAEEQEQFELALTDRLYCRHWCRNHGIDYSTPDIDLVKELVYSELYTKK